MNIWLLGFYTGHIWYQRDSDSCRLQLGAVDVHAAMEDSTHDTAQSQSSCNRAA